MVERDALTMTRWLADLTRPVDAVDDIDLLRQVEVGLFGAPAEPVVIGRYALVRLLGRGGFGRVYEADDPELDRRVAVKLVDVASLPIGTESDAFRHEARALARVRHPHCVSVFDVGSYDLDGEARQRAVATSVAPSGVYIVMEFVRGQQLATWLEQPHPIAVVLDVFEQLAGALAAAHAVGVIHGDFKPGNVVVDESGHAQVLDFGLARLLDPLERASEDVATDRIIGTPRYMAPEQHGGARATARSDQFSWGASLCEAIGGALPSAIDTVDEHAASRPAVSGTGRERRLPGWLAPVVQRAMAPLPAARFEDMGELLAALRRARGRRRAFGRGVGVAVAAVSIAALGATAASRAPACPATLALDPLWNADSQARLEAAFLASGRPHAQTSWGNVQSDLQAWADRYVAHGSALCATPGATNSAALRCLEEQASRFAGVLGVLRSGDAANVDDAHAVVAALPEPGSCVPLASDDTGIDVVAQYEGIAAVKALLALGRTAEARSRAAELLADAALEPRAAVEVLAVAGRAAASEGDEAGADASLRRMLSLATEHHLAGAETIALSCLAYSSAVLGDAGAARTYEQLARGRMPMHDGDADVSIPALRCLANLEDHRDDHAAFARSWSAIRDLTAARFGEDHPLTLAALEEIGFGRYRQGDNAGAHELVASLPERLATRLGEEHPATLDAAMLRALIDAEVGRLDQATAAMTRLLDAHERVLGPDHLMTATAFHNAAIIALRGNRPAEAVAWASRGLEIRAGVLGLGAEPTLDTAVTLAAAHRSAHRSARGRRAAIEVLDRVIGPGRERLGDQHPVVVRARSVRLQLLAADEHDAAGIVEEARLLVDQARSGRHDVAIELIAMRTLATALHASGRRDEAAIVLRELRDRECDRPTPNPRHCAEAKLYEAVARLELGQRDALAEVREELTRYAEIPGTLDRDRWFFRRTTGQALEHLGLADEAAIEYTAALPAIEADAAGALTQAVVAWGVARLTPLPNARRRELGELALAAFEGEGATADATAVARWLESLPTK